MSDCNGIYFSPIYDFDSATVKINSVYLEINGNESPGDFIGPWNNYGQPPGWDYSISFCAKSKTYIEGLGNQLRLFALVEVPSSNTRVHGVFAEDDGTIFQVFTTPFFMEHGIGYVVKYRFSGGNHIANWVAMSDQVITSGSHGVPFYGTRFTLINNPSPNGYSTYPWGAENFQKWSEWVLHISNMHNDFSALFRIRFEFAVRFVFVKNSHFSEFEQASKHYIDSMDTSISEPLLSYRRPGNLGGGTAKKKYTCGC